MSRTRSTRRSPGGSWSSDGVSGAPLRVPSDVAASAVPRHRPGDLIDGKYRIVELLGRGGAGEVFRAHHEVLDVDVALKVLRPESGWNRAAERFQKEARAAARLEHPAIARTMDFGQSEAGEPFLVMELLQGEDLSLTLSKRKHFPATAAVRTLLPIACGLSLAHSRGIVHRDLKPENIFLARAEDDRVTPKIVDFGIAKLEGDGLGQHLTQTGELLGSPVYMSPEHARGEDVDQRGDIWAFSVVLYEMIAGHAPFSGGNYNAVIHSITTADPASIEGVGGVDEALWTIMKRALAKDPADRWQSMQDLGEALAGWLLARGIREDVTGGSVESAFRGRTSGFPDGRAAVASQPLIATLPPRAERAQSSRRWLNLGAGLVLVFVGGLVLWKERAPHDSAAPDGSRAAAAISRGPVSSGSSDVHPRLEPATADSAAPVSLPQTAATQASVSRSPVLSDPVHGTVRARPQARTAAPKGTAAPAKAAPIPRESGLKDPFQ